MKARKRIRYEWSPWAQQTADDERLTDMAEIARDALAETFRCSDLQVWPVRRCLEAWRGRVLHPEVLEEMLRLLCGNVPALRARRLVGPWTIQTRWEWVPVEVVEVRLQDDSWTVRFDVLAGSAAGRYLQRRCSRRWALLQAVRNGYSWRGSKAVEHPRQLVQLRMAALLRPDRETRTLAALRFEPVQELQAHNQRVIDLRLRRRGFSCPLHLPDSCACHECYMGLDESQTGRWCPAACRPQAALVVDCQRCRRPFLASTTDEAWCPACRKG